MAKNANPLQALLEQSANFDLFAQTGRYASVGKGQTTLPDGRVVGYLNRRILPAPTANASQVEVEIKEGDRLDIIAYRYLRDPELFYKIADENAAMNPLELAQDPGAKIKISPQG